MSEIDATVWNTRERLLSSDLTRSTDLLHRALMETLAALSGDQVSGVIRGMEAAAPGTGMTVNVTAGLALLFDSSQVYPDSDWRWIELQADDIVTIPAAHATLNRWDVIEIAPATQATSTQSRDIYSGTLGTFTPQSVTKEQASRPTISVRQGTAATSPALPAGTTGVIPLAYVYVQAATTTIAGTDVVRCRPLVAIQNSSDVWGPFLGGGVEVTATGVDVAVTRPFRGRFTNGPDMVVAGGASHDLSASSQARVDSALTYPPVADAMIYLYAMPPPWPTGYDATLCRRELYSTGTRVPSMSSNTWNCLVIASNKAPAVVTDDQGAPAGSVAINDPTWGALSVSASDFAYLGTVFYDFSNTGLAKQIVTGAVVERPDTGTYPTETFNIETGGGSAVGDLRRVSPLTPSGAQIIPSTAKRFGLTWWCSNVYGTSSTAGDISLSLETDSAADDVTLEIPDLSALTDISDTTWVQSDDGSFDWNYANTSNGSRLTVYVKSYEDRVIAAR